MLRRETARRLEKVIVVNFRQMHYNVIQCTGDIPCARMCVMDPPHRNQNQGVSSGPS